MAPRALTGPSPPAVAALLVGLTLCRAVASRLTAPPAHPLHSLETWDGSGGDSVRADVMDPFIDLRDGLEVMQTSWFELWVGTWPAAIDWTSAVINTFMVAALSRFSTALHYPPAERSFCGPRDPSEVENELNLYFAQSAAYYFGEDAFEIRYQAYDDMLWVVLGWLEGVKFVDSHARRQSALSVKQWHGIQYTDAFAHRARVFYDIASRGWDTKLCCGGMIWNPSLIPYKNAITNQLYIAASVSMYLHFPGDNNSSPFAFAGVQHGIEPAVPQDKKYLTAAVDAYEWLNNSGMTNDQGLYADGFHIRGWNRHGSIGTGKCDERNEMVYSYNQGVVLSGLRGLWESTGVRQYLEDGHELIHNAIAATGWNFERSKPPEDSTWSGLGRNGTLEDWCDHSGRCDQDGQIFKGIFFRHFTMFCQPLPLEPLIPGVTFTADKELFLLHRRTCQAYAPWVLHNARAALGTRNEEGKFGGWWGALDNIEALFLPRGAVDYRNNASELANARWQLMGTSRGPGEGQAEHQQPLRGLNSACGRACRATGQPYYSPYSHKDLNDRGRGRTVETQASGISVLHALCEFLDLED